MRQVPEVTVLITGDGSAAELELSSSEHIEATLNTTINANIEINFSFFILFYFEVRKAKLEKLIFYTKFSQYILHQTPFGK